MKIQTSISRMIKTFRKKIPALLAFGLFSQFLFGQNLKINLDNRAKDDQYSKLILLVNFYELYGDTIANPIDVASSKPMDAFTLKKINKPTVPAGVAASKWCYGYLYNLNSVSEFNPKYTLVLYINPVLTAYPGYIWVDKNNNLDLTDDGEPHKITNDSSVLVKLDNRPNGYQVALERLPNPFAGPKSDFFYTLYRSNDNFLDTFRKTCRYRHFIPTMYGLRERRLNLVGGNWSNGRDSFMIGIKDNNYNGLYNDKERDAILIGNPNSSLDNLQAVKLDDKGKAYIEWNNCAYTINNIDPEGFFIELNRDSTAKLRNSLNVGAKLPRFKYTVSAKKESRKSIRRQRGHMTYIYIWRPGLPQFESDSADLRKLASIQDKEFVVLGLNNGSSSRYVLSYNKLWGNTMKHGFSSNKINKKLKVKKIPTGILVDKRQRIIAVGISPEEAKTLVEQRKKKKKA